MSSKKKGRKKDDAERSATAAGRTAPQPSLPREAERLKADMRMILKGDAQRAQHVLEALRGPLGKQMVLAEIVEGHSLPLLPFGAIIADCPELLTLRLELGRDAQQVGNEGCLPAMAVKYWAPGCLVAALKAGADPNHLHPTTLQRPLHFLAAKEPLSRDSDMPVLVRRRASGEEAALLEVSSMARVLKEAGADITLADGEPGDPEPGACPVVHAIGLQLLRNAAILADVFASGQPSQAQQMDWASYVRALLELEARPTDEQQLQQAGAAELLAVIQNAWQPRDDAGQPPARAARGPAGAAEPKAVAELLEEAVERGCLLTTRWLLQSADAEAANRRAIPDCSPVWSQALEDDLEDLLLLLLQQCPASLDLTARDAVGRVLLVCAVEERRPELLDAICIHASRPVLRQLLEARDQETGHTALGRAVASGNTPALARLLQECREAGLEFGSLLALPKAEAKGPEHMLPVICAITRGALGPVRMLLAAGLDLRSPVCIQPQRDGEVLNAPAEANGSITPLMAAALRGSLPAVSLLLAAGADPQEAVPGNGPQVSAVALALSFDRLPEFLADARLPVELVVHAQAWLRTWETKWVTGRHGGFVGTPPESAAASAWLRAWMTTDAGGRFACVLQLLWAGGGLTGDQLGCLFVLLRAWTARAGHADATASALAGFLWRRLKPCAQCGLLGRWRRCACKRAWYCGRACQKQHWKAGHERKCRCAQQLQQRPKA